MMYNNYIPHYDAIKKNDTEQTYTLQWPSMNCVFMILDCMLIFISSSCRTKKTGKIISLAILSVN